MAEVLTADLVSRAVAGESGAIEALLRVAQTDIRRYARRSCRNASDAEEAAQEALIILYRKIGTLRQVGAISGWLLRIVNRFCLRLALRLAGVPFAVEAEAIEQHFAQMASPICASMSRARSSRCPSTTEPWWCCATSRS